MMEAAKKYLCADLSLEIPGLNQKFYLYREQFGRHITGIGDIWYRPTYEAVYVSESQWKGADIGSKMITKLIFISDAEKNECPPGVEEILAAVPADMLQFLVQTLNDRWAVVTFAYNGTKTEYTINFSRSEVWEQEEYIMHAVNFAIDEEFKTLGPYCIVEDGTAERVPGSPIGEYPVPQEGVFWVIDEKIVTVKEVWDRNSESPAALFDHQKQWAKLPCEVTQGKPFDHYPRGQVQIKDCQATVLCHHSLIHSPYPFMIAGKFQIPQMNTCFLAYGYPKEYADQLYKDFD